MAGRRSLAELVGEESPVAEAAAESSPPAAAPLYLRLTRKEARIREEQYDRLTAIARRLERRRPTNVGERITENTLIRVAIDLLLDREAELGGASEEEIRRSVSR